MPGRFTTLESRWLAVAERALSDTPDAPPGAGLIALGGFAFADDGAGSPAWHGFGCGVADGPRALLRPQGSMRPG